MAFLSASERAFLRAVSQLAYCNPFLPERIECERAALGAEFVEGEPVWSLPVDQIFRDIIGSWLAAARLRASVWQSIFTHDMRRYQRTLYQRMGDFATLITGPSGTGKELAARAIAQSRYVPFDERRLEFAGDEAASFFPINISALSPTLVESELFGHRRGSFTGAIADRKGWLETRPALGSVFFDELGDLDPTIQVKLLRVIETRTFHPVGDTASRKG